MNERVERRTGVDLPTYTNIWRIEKRLYKLYDLRLPMPLPIVWIGVFVGVFVPWSLLLVLVGVPVEMPWHVLYLVPPGIVTWLSTRPVIEGKRLTELLESQLRYLGQPKAWYRLAPTSEPETVTFSARVWRTLPARAKSKAPRKARHPQRRRDGQRILGPRQVRPAVAAAAAAASQAPVAEPTTGRWGTRRGTAPALKAPTRQAAPAPAPGSKAGALRREEALPGGPGRRQEVPLVTGHEGAPTEAVALAHGGKTDVAPQERGGKTGAAARERVGEGAALERGGPTEGAARERGGTTEGAARERGGAGEAAVRERGGRAEAAARQRDRRDEAAAREVEAVPGLGHGSPDEARAGEPLSTRESRKPATGKPIDTEALRRLRKLAASADAPPADTVRRREEERREDERPEDERREDEAARDQHRKGQPPRLGPALVLPGTKRVWPPLDPNAKPLPRPAAPKHARTETASDSPVTQDSAQPSTASGAPGTASGAPVGASGTTGGAEASNSGIPQVIAAVPDDADTQGSAEPARDADAQESAVPARDADAQGIAESAVAGSREIAQSAGAGAQRTAESAGADVRKTAEPAGADVRKTAEPAGADVQRTAESTGDDRRGAAEGRADVPERVSGGGRPDEPATRRERVEPTAPDERMEPAARGERVEQVARSERVDESAGRGRVDESAGRERVDESARRGRVEQRAPRERVEPAARGGRDQGAAAREGAGGLVAPVPVPRPGEGRVRRVESVVGRDSGGWRRIAQVVVGGGGVRTDGSEIDEARARGVFSGSRRIVVLGCTGGAGQSTTALMLGHTFAKYRDDRVVAVDANTGGSTLTSKIQPETPETLTSLLSGLDRVSGYLTMRGYTTRTASGLEVISADTDAGAEQRLADRSFFSDHRLGESMRLLDRHYKLAVIDPAPALAARVLPYADQLVLVVPASEEASEAVAMTYEWLDGHGCADLRRRAVMVVNGVSRRSMADVEQAESVARGRCRAIVRVPWEDGLAPDGAEVVDPGQLRAAGRRAYLALAGVVVAGFAAKAQAQTVRPSEEELASDPPGTRIGER
ncbi:TcpE family conjugal transfer membrane protein [Nonomuraea sp. NPDC050786]|uniref:TcpE family conjugal transfer membrane protein n=1 Tax=Nonomuraea sp. NPDC050786 TaxID=3154840 RepID=UPI0033E7C33B